MRHALILAGGSGTRLWPMSREALPKQLLPLINGKCLLDIAYSRLEGCIPNERRFICAAEGHQDVIREMIPSVRASQYIGEPVGRDTLNALGLSAAAIASEDPDAVIAVFTADHLIEPVDEFLSLVETACEVVEQDPATLMTFGVTPTYAATGFGYLELGDDHILGSKIVNKFKEKPDAERANTYFSAGAKRYLWNSGMFVWKASTFLDLIQRYEPEVHAGLQEISAAWNTPDANRVIDRVYPTLKKISVDFAIMEPASRDSSVRVASIDLPLTWLDVGSWPAYAETCDADQNGNASGAAKSVLQNCSGVLAVSSDPDHVVAALGCKDIIIVHTPDATLVCNKHDAEAIKQLRAQVADSYGESFI